MVNIAIALINGETRTFIEYLYHNSLNNIELILLISPTLEGDGEGGDEEGLKEMHFQHIVDASFELAFPSEKAYLILSRGIHLDVDRVCRILSLYYRYE